MNNLDVSQVPEPKISNQGYQAEEMKESIVNVMEQSSFILATNTNEIEVINKTPGKENVPLTKNSVGL